MCVIDVRQCCCLVTVWVPDAKGGILLCELLIAGEITKDILAVLVR